MLHALRVKVATVTAKDSATTTLHNAAFEEQRKAFTEYGTQITKISSALSASVQTYRGLISSTADLAAALQNSLDIKSSGAAGDEKKGGGAAAGGAGAGGAAALPPALQKQAEDLLAKAGAIEKKLASIRDQITARDKAATETDYYVGKMLELQKDRAKHNGFPKPADKEKFERNEKKLADHTAAYEKLNADATAAIKEVLDRKGDAIGEIETDFFEMQAAFAAHLKATVPAAAAGSGVAADVHG